MNISLSPDLEKFIQDKIASGLYTSATEVIRESLRLLSAYDELQKKRLEHLNKEMDIGLMQLASKQGINADTAYKQLQQSIKPQGK